MNKDLRWDKDFALEQVGHDENLLRECLYFFLEAAKEDLNRLEKSVFQKDFDEIKSAAHSLKGAALNIGMKSIMELALDIEKAAINENIHAIKKAMPCLKELVKKVSQLNI